MQFALNQRAVEMVERVLPRSDELRIDARHIAEASVLDFGIRAEGGLEAGRQLAQISMAGLGRVDFAPADLGGSPWPHVVVASDQPVAACLLSQYAGWQVTAGKFFAMGSGPMRAAYGREKVFESLDYREQASAVVGVLKGAPSRTRPSCGIFCERTGITSDKLTLLIAPTASQAGNVQVVSRSVETALHKLFELGFDLGRIRSATGMVPLPPVAANDMAGIGRTNDAILYAARVMLWVRGDDASLEEIGPRVPADSSAAFGKPFLEVFEAAGRDFYEIDPHLFSPAEVTFCNLDTGRVHRFGRVEPQIVRHSFGLE